MKFTTEFYEMIIRVDDWKRMLLRELRKYNQEAGRAWIDEAVNKTPIPTWSGASRATFQKLAIELGTSVPIGPILSRNSRVGLGLSTSASSGVIEEIDRGFVGFLYSTDLRYLHYNEYNRAVAGPPPQPYSNNVRFTPYGFQPRAARAWEAVAKKATLPNPYHQLTKRRI